MKSHARVVVIGGGIVGCSVLYHLTRLGWKDVVLLERKELTSGSSWHAAGGFHAINGDPNIARLQSYGIRTYQEVQQISGQDIGIHMTGGISVTATKERWEFLRAEHAHHRVLGLDTHLVGPEEIRSLCPIMDTRDVCGAVYDVNEGHLDPAGATHAYAKAAGVNGAEIYRHTRVVELAQLPSGGWLVVTDGGAIRAEHIVNAGGLWAREIGLMVGAELPLVPMEHHYLVTDDLPELRDLDREIALTVDLDGEIYLRQERKGVLLGVYEKEATPWALNGTPWDYGETELLPPNLERIAEALERGFKRFPSLQSAGIRRIVNGPFTFTPDGNPLIGPLAGLSNYWVACGVMAGFSQAGGIGLALSQWIIDGEPDSDIFAMDVARFGSFATHAYVKDKASEFYARRFQLHYPNEHWPAGRPGNTSALHELTRSNNAVYGASFGQEIPLYFAAVGTPAEETPSLRRTNSFDYVGLECRAVREGVGIIDGSSYAKYEVTGPGAVKWLDHMAASRLPAVGRVRLAPFLSPHGRMMGDLTIMRLAEERFMIFGSGYLQDWHMRWFSSQLPQEGVKLRNVTLELAGIIITGPRARELLARLTSENVSASAFPFMSVRETELLSDSPAIIGRISVTGELGYEIYAPVGRAHCLAQKLFQAAEGLNARHVGMYALNALRLEKSYGIWSREFSTDYTPRTCGLSKYVAYDKPDFVGRDAALLDRDRTPSQRLVTLEVDAQDADAIGFEPIWQGDTYVGYTTSGGYGHIVKQSLAMGYLDCASKPSEVALEISIAGERRRARVLTQPAIDPQGNRLRS